MLHIERGQHVEPYGESTRPSQPERERERDLHPRSTKNQSTVLSLSNGFSLVQKRRQIFPFLFSSRDMESTLSISLFLRLNVYHTQMCVSIHLLTSGTNSIHASLVGREGAKTPSPFLERALHSSEGRDSYPFLSCSNGEETVSSSLPRKTYAPSFLFRAEEIMSLV